MPTPVALKDSVQLRLTKLALSVIFLCMLVAYKQVAVWPVAHWTMYSASRVDYPPDTTSMLDLRVMTATGANLSVDLRSLFPPGRSNVPSRLAVEAFGLQDETERRQRRQLLTNMIRRALPGRRLRTVELFRLTWAVDPSGDPPLTRSSPDEKLLVGRYDVEPPSELRTD